MVRRLIGKINEALIVPAFVASLVFAGLMIPAKEELRQRVNTPEEEINSEPCPSFRGRYDVFNRLSYGCLTYSITSILGTTFFRRNSPDQD